MFMETEFKQPEATNIPEQIVFSTDPDFVASVVRELQTIIPTGTTTPTYIPKRFVDCFYCKSDGTFWVYINKVWVSLANTTLASLRPIKSGTFASGSATYNKSDSGVTADSIIDVYAQSTPIGTWSVASSAGSFTITSTATETGNVAFKYFINN